MKTKAIYFFCLALVFLSSCEKNISFKLNDEEPKLVVEASIENGQAPNSYTFKQP
ncbi:MAG: hypothetical protein WDO19_00320 [Bacteroidota bacterium]